MLIDALINFFGILLSTIAGWLPSWTIWPQAFIDGINYFFSTIATLNIIFPIDTLFLCLTRFIEFIGLYYFARIIAMSLNWIRGSGEIKI
jgi:hypothetical protein